MFGIAMRKWWVRSIATNAILTRWRDMHNFGLLLGKSTTGGCQPETAAAGGLSGVFPLAHAKSFGRGSGLDQRESGSSKGISCGPKIRGQAVTFALTKPAMCPS